MNIYGEMFWCAAYLLATGVFVLATAGAMGKYVLWAKRHNPLAHNGFDYPMTCLECGEVIGYRDRTWHANIYHDGLHHYQPTGHQ